MFASKDLFFTKPSGGYQISRSVRLRSSATAYFNRTPASAATDGKKFTWSGWVKRGTLTSLQVVLSADAGASTAQVLYFSSADTVIFATGATQHKATTAVFRDPSAWYHIVLVGDTTQATAGDRLKLYINGVAQVWTTTTDPTLNSLWLIGKQSTLQGLGYSTGSVAYYTDGYLTEINFIDGQALTPSSFGQTNSVTGVWQPIKYGGTYGTNGFYLNFSDNSNNTATTIGKDYSGNGNNWTPNNISVTAGATYDSMLDVPTPYADGGNGRGNYAVMNPLQLPTAASTVLSNANLLLTCNSGTSFNSFSNGTMYPTSGKYYAEFYINTVGECYVGISRFTDASTPNSWNSQSTYYNRGGVIQKDGSTTASVATYTTGDTIGVAYDVDNATCAFYKNNTLVGTVTGVTAGSYTFSIAGYLSCAVSFNTGQRPFTYTPPTGFVALNTQNLPTPTISNGANYMAATTYTGTGSSLTIANTVGSASFQPDFVWVKGRSGATDHALYDSVRGTTKDLVSNSTAAETTQATGLTAFGSTGFTVGALAKMNTNTATYVGWQWKAGGTAVTNTAGSITSTVSAGATQGFSVVTWTGTGANATVGHGLGVAPKMIINKPRNAVDNWISWHTALGNLGYIYLNTTGAAGSGAVVWNSTLPTSTVFSVGTSSNINTNGQTMVSYCFAEVAGYSKFGSYTGNGSADGPFVFTNFQPRWVMVKRTDSTSDWYIWDTSRDTYNVEAATLLADTSGAETSATSIDGLSNGFKCRSATVVNASGGTYIYAAFASSPFKLSLAR